MTYTKANSSSKNRAHPLKSVAADDGHNYYLINSSGARGVANVHYLAYYSSLNEYAPEEIGSTKSSPTGFFYVRDAASSGTDHYGDPTVKAGWAMYIWDVAKYQQGVQNSGWVKIAQQGDVDWDITDELKALFVLKTVYNARVNDVDQRFDQDEAIVTAMNKRIVIVEEKIDEIYPLAHSHFYYDESGTKQGENLSVLNRLDDKYKCLYYRGKPIGGNSYIYDHIEYNEQLGRNEIVWCDPTVDETEWTHEVVKNSDEIAAKILATDIARIGLTLIVTEVDGSLSIYKYIRSDERDPGVYDFDKKVVFDPTDWHPSNWADLPLFTRFYTRGISSTPGATWSDWEYIGYYHPELAEAGDVLALKVKNKLALAAEESGNQVSGYTEQIAYVVPSVKLTYKFAQTIVADNLGLAEYVTTLPTATKWHYNRGCWVPLVDDGEHVVGHLHKCVEEAAFEGDYVDASWEVYDSSKTYYQENDAGQIVVKSSLVVRKKGSGTEDYICGAADQGGKPILRAGDPTKSAGYRYYWVDIQDNGESIATLGAKPLVSYTEEGSLWKDVYIYWKDPEDTTTSGGTPVKWTKTILVRKSGSAPESTTDGIQVMSSTTRNQYLDEPFHEAVPYSTTPVYYRLFSVSKSGGQYALSPAFKAEKLDWTHILDIIESGYIGKIWHANRYLACSDTIAVQDSTLANPYYYRYVSASEEYAVYVVSKGSALERTTEYPDVYTFDEASHVILPTHSVYGDIECEVVGVGQDVDVDHTARNCVIVMATKALCSKFVDAIELKYALTEDTTRVSWKKYYEYDSRTLEYTLNTSASNPLAAGLYELNPEWSSVFASGRGSNGAVDMVGGGTTVVHNVGTTNIHQWLNSTAAAGSWYSAQTLFDQGSYTVGDVTHSYLAEAGFLAGFEDTSMFATMSAYSLTSAHLTIPACKVSLPCSNQWYYKNITPVKTSGRFTASVSWATFSGAPKIASETDSYRAHSGFYDGKDGTTVVAPEAETNIFPVFMIGRDA